MKLTKVAFAVAGLLAIAGGAVQAGQIDSSSATLAIEVIKNNDQVVRAPSKSYNFAGDIDARTNEQRLQLQYTLSKGTWPAATGNMITGADTLVDVSGLPVLKVAYSDGTNAAQTAFPAGTTINAFVTNAGKTLAFNVTIPAAAGNPINLLKTPTFTLNSDAMLTTQNTGITSLYDVAGATACPAPDQTLDVNFKHFTNHTGSATLQTVASPDSEHLRGGSTNDARLLNFTQNLIWEFAPAANSSKTDAATLNTKLKGENFSTTAGNFTALGAVVGAGTHHYIGKVNLKPRSNGLDLDYTHAYGNASGAAATPFDPLDFNSLAEDTGSLQAGEIELKNVVYELTLPAAWPVGTVVHAYDATGANIGLGYASAATTAGQTVITIKSNNVAADDAALANGAYLFAVFPGTPGATIAQTASVSVKASLVKDTVAGAPDLREQDNVCSGGLTGIGGGIKIDVRNYASYATFGATGPATTVRIINNSEYNAADVYGQMIYADGKYGPWGLLTTLAPREVANLSNQTIESLLVNAPAASNPFGSATKYTKADGSAVVAGPKAGISDRLRIVSNTGTTLRVQSYMVVGSSVIDTSNAQGVDFENSGDRVPVDAVDAQPVSQDAINGLSKN